MCCWWFWCFFVYVYLLFSGAGAAEPSVAHLGILLSYWNVCCFLTICVTVLKCMGWGSIFEELDICVWWVKQMFFSFDLFIGICVCLLYGFLEKCVTAPLTCVCGSLRSGACVYIVLTYYNTCLFEQWEMWVRAFI